MRLRRPPRCATFDYTGEHRYFLTMCTFSRRPLFTLPAIVKPVRSQILRTLTVRDFAVLAYVFMPDHAHFLLQGSKSDSAFTPAITTARRMASTVCPRVHRPLWQDGYFERVVRSAEGTQQVIDYILNNPVRAGLVERAADYEFSWSVTLDRPAALATTPTDDRP